MFAKLSLFDPETKQMLILEGEEEFSLRLDGDQWCVLYGINLQEGVCGFGKTKEEAIGNFVKNFLKDKTLESRG